jgi:hypothetical protein
VKGQKNAQRRYLNLEGLLKLPDMLISPNFAALPSALFGISSSTFQSEFITLERYRAWRSNDFSNAMLFAFCNDNGK